MTKFDLNQLSGPHAAVIEMLKDQLLIVLIKRLGGKVDLPCAEVDDTAGDNLAFSVDQETRVFHFEVWRKDR